MMPFLVACLLLPVAMWVGYAMGFEDGTDSAIDNFIRRMPR